MLADHSFIYFAPEPWDGLWRNRQQLMSVFARQNLVLFVEPRLHFRPTIAAFRRGELRPASLFEPLVRQVAEKLFTFRYPVWAPISGHPLLDRPTRTLRRLALKRAMDQLGLSQPVVWFSRPDMIDLIDEIPSARLRLYHIVDEYTAYGHLTPEKRRRIKQNEREMLGRVDLAVVVSDKLYQSKRPLNANTYLVENGVNYQAYSAALHDPGLPDDLQAIPSPRLGYIGLIADKLNLNMLKALAEENRDWSLVLLGQARVTRQVDVWQALQRLPNVYYLGLAPVEQVPHYVKGFQIGLMPYFQDEHAENISPLKLYDYLAAGIPIASVNIPMVCQFSQLIHLANTPAEFPQAVRAALADRGPERYQLRRDIAAQHSWEIRAEQLSALIQAHLVVS